jgi:hypothetical protein
MVACVAGMLFDEFEEFLPPRVIGVGKQLFSKRFQVVNADHFDVLLDRLASILVDLLDIKVLGSMPVDCFRVSATDQQIGLHLKAESPQ